MTQRDQSDTKWQKDRLGREFIRAKGRPGLVWRRETETEEQAWRRDQKAQEHRARLRR